LISTGLNLMAFFKRILSVFGLVATDAVQPVATPRGLDQPPLLIDSTPDAPQAFGRKVHWFTVRSDDTDAVAQVLQLSDVHKANWASGMQVAYFRPADPQHNPYEHHVFVTPPLQGWVFIVSHFLYMTTQEPNALTKAAPSGFDALFSALFTSFSDVQFLGSYRGVGQIDWARARHGKIERMYGFADGVYANVGAQTSEERALRLLDVSGLSNDQATEAVFDYVGKINDQEASLMKSGLSWQAAQDQVRAQFLVAPFSDEELPLAIAAAWGLSPDTLEDGSHPHGVGIIGKLPAQFIDAASSSK
jgi:hypothetical protein